MFCMWIMAYDVYEFDEIDMFIQSEEFVVLLFVACISFLLLGAYWYVFFS